MDLLAAGAMVAGLAGAVLGGLGWWKARAAAAAAAACLNLAQAETTRAPVMTGFPNGGGEDMESSPPRAARAAGVRRPGDDAQRADLVVRPGSAAGQDVPTNQGSGSGLLGVFVVNQGPAVARELRFSATFPDGTVRSSESHRSLSAHKEMTLFAQVLPQDFGPGASVDVLYQVAYRDGNGEQTLERKVRLDGGWKGPWKTFLDADGVASDARANGSPLSAPYPTATHD